MLCKGKGTKICSSDLDQDSISFMHMPNALSELCSKFQISASNTVGGVAKTGRVLKCDVIKLYM